MLKFSRSARKHSVFPSISRRTARRSPPPRCSYFSFSTLTTVGFGDLTARSDLGRTLAVLEALVGQLYLVTVVSVGVSNLVPRARAGSQQ